MLVLAKPHNLDVSKMEWKRLFLPGCATLLDVLREGDSTLIYGFLLRKEYPLFLSSFSSFPWRAFRRVGVEEDGRV